MKKKNTGTADASNMGQPVSTTTGPSSLFAPSTSRGAYAPAEIGTGAPKPTAGNDPAGKGGFRGGDGRGSLAAVDDEGMIDGEDSDTGIRIGRVATVEQTDDVGTTTTAGETEVLFRVERGDGERLRAAPIVGRVREATLPEGESGGFSTRGVEEHARVGGDIDAECPGPKSSAKPPRKKVRRLVSNETYVRSKVQWNTLVARFLKGLDFIYPAE